MGLLEKEVAARLCLWLGEVGCVEQGLWYVILCEIIDICVLWHRSCFSVEQGEAVSPSRFFYPLFSMVLMGSPGLLLSALGLGLRSTELGRQGEEEKLSWGFRNGPFSVPK